MSILRSYKLAASATLLFVGSVALAQNNPSITDQAQAQAGSTNYPGVNAAWQPSLVRDGVYDHVPHVSEPIKWQPIREADVMWQKRIWREIDTREKQNAAFRYPGDESTGGGYFIEILIDAIKRGKIKAYSNFDDRFTNALSKEQIIEMLVGKPDTNYIVDPVTNQTTISITRKDFNPDLITKFRIKEDMIFDRNVGRMVVHIIGIAPYKDILEEDGTYRASQALFWLYYPEIRPLLAQYEVFNPENDAARMTWDEFFEDRLFSSRIIKVSNPFDESYSQMGIPNMQALYLGKKEAEKFFNKEQDMWVH